MSEDSGDESVAEFEVEEVVDPEEACHIEPAAEEEEEEGDGQAVEDNDILLMNDGNIVEDTDGRLCYLYWCDKLNTTPVSQILKFLNGSSVSVNHYGITKNGLYALAQALQVNRSVTTVSLKNTITDTGSLKSFFDILSGNQTITSINLSGNRIGLHGCKALARFLREGTCRLADLNLSNNRLTDKSARTLLEALEANESLRALDLSRNALNGKSTTPVLCAFLRSRNTTLRRLDLGWNTLKGKGCSDILQALSGDCTLTNLKLSWNGLGDEGAALISEVLSGADLSSELDLELLGNGITDSGFLKILGALSKDDEGSKPKILRLGENYIFEERFEMTTEGHCMDRKSGEVYKIGAPVEIQSDRLKLGYSNLK